MIADLHCDLLLYLQMKAGRTPFDALSRASHTQMKAGGVKLQTLAIFTYPEKGSTISAQQQIDIFSQLPHQHPEHFAFFSELPKPTSEKVTIVPAFENASGFCEEDEPLDRGLARLQHYYEKLKRILYISLTWDGENRFGGGNGSSVGLKPDGKQLLRWMSGKKIAVDLSHTSDALAQDILTFIDQEKLNIPVMASHSNFRVKADMPRNLPDELAQEIIRRDGLIGFNFFSMFVGDPKNLLKHAEHGLKMKGEKALCFGADFFCDADFPGLRTKYKTDKFFFDEYGDSSAYPHVLGMFEKDLKLPDTQLKAIASDNFFSFIKRLWN
jgi:membrane dipeptidase